MQNNNSKLNTILTAVLVIVFSVWIWVLIGQNTDTQDVDVQTTSEDYTETGDDELINYLEDQNYFLIESIDVNYTARTTRISLVVVNRIENKKPCGQGMVVSSIIGNPSIPYLDCIFISTNTSHWGTEYPEVGTWPNEEVREKHGELFEDDDHNTYASNSVRYVWGKILFSSKYTDGATCAYQRQDWEMDPETGVTTLLYKTPLKGNCFDGD